MKAPTEMVVVGKDEACAAVVMEAAAVEAVHATAVKDRAGAAISAAAMKATTSAVEHCTAVKSAAAMKTTAAAMEATATAMATPWSAADFGNQRVRGDFRDRRCGGTDW